MQTTSRIYSKLIPQFKNADDFRMVRFKGRVLVETRDPYPHFVPLCKELFEQSIYQANGSTGRTQINNLFSYARSTAEDLSQNDHFIVFGNKVWDTEELTMRSDIAPDDCVWRSPYACPSNRSDTPVQFIMNLAAGNQGLYDDIMQSLAPLVMAKKPDGVIWWVSDNHKGVSMLLEAIHQIFPNQLSSISIKSLIGGRVTPLLNDTFGNVVKEISDGQVENSDVYKSIATHEDFMVHKYHSQRGLKIRGNIHHIFSADHLPRFIRKGYSTHWRTFVVPFAQLTTSNTEKLTSIMLGQLIAEMCSYANRIDRQGYRYKWSAISGNIL